MSCRASEMPGVDLEQGGHRRSASGSDASGEGECSLCFSDAEDGSCHSEFLSTGGGSCDERWSEAEGKKKKKKKKKKVEIGSGVGEVKVHLERDCRICHLGLESSSNECGIAIELGCSCKDDLAAAHKHCAEAWFKIKGNKTCEICHSVVRNVGGGHEVEVIEQGNESTNAAAVAVATARVATTVAGGGSFWQVHRVLNFLLACMVFAFVISWLFHFNVPS